jgi:hypothetical protein
MYLECRAQATDYGVDCRSPEVVPGFLKAGSAMALSWEREQQERLLNNLCSMFLVTKKCEAVNSLVRLPS